MEKYKCVKTVGELKEFLEKLDPNMGLDLIATCYKGRNFCTIKKNRYKDHLEKVIENNEFQISLFHFL